MTERRLMTGNEALAHGAWEAGVRVAASYPGTPATEINEAMFHLPGVSAEWSVNEKVALEVGIGASVAGARTLVAMKHVGVNVAADPLFTLVYTGVGAGLVLVTADEPGFHSSQNEQDNRLYAKFAQLPMLEPSNAQEAHDMARLAFALSEEHDTPVLLRMTTRICHTKSPVTLGTREEVPVLPYRKNASKFVMLPAHAGPRHRALVDRIARLEAVSETSPLNRIEMRDPSIGVVTSGISYENVREALPDASILKIGLSYPPPAGLVRRFRRLVGRMLVIEEGRPYLEEHIRVLGVEVEGKLPGEEIGEIPARHIRRRVLGGGDDTSPPPVGLPTRPPQLCPGCGHRGLFHILSRKNYSVKGDIGCYTLGALPPFGAMDTCVCMGASIGMEHGFSKVEGVAKRSVAVIGDSTFFHSGMNNLLNAVFNGGRLTVIILDNRVTAMTGHQENPGSMTAPGSLSPSHHHVDIAEICRAMGVRHVTDIDGYDLERIEAALAESIERPEPSVILVRSRCVFVEKEHPDTPHAVDHEACKNCKLCLKVGCPAITVTAESEIEITDFLCDGCHVCADVCPFDAIHPVEAHHP